ncbi:hypothetical protein K435DRAFT_780067 [Dendrothele bispora CBS 962.96]|uniref:Uncharacterized protein n=1 Tax=Dendrothele bispora (strain CBS 962.96) TaxID=1314807 RepID=A0A4S8LU59_DENBC|nr:hypothetical protein K435DRAFT_780067 [Dendrothele bispora CBS 962.96]
MSCSQNSPLGAILCTHCQANALSDPTTLSWKSHLDRINVLLKSNDPPLPEEADKMRDSRAEAKLRSRNIEKELELMEQRRILLQKEKRDIDEYLTVQERVLEPIRSIPVEILAKIFIICVDNVVDPETRYYDDPLSTKSVRWVLSYVCSRWRNVALTTPMMWDNIQLNIGTGIYESASIRSLLLGTHIQLSGSRPLTVGLYGFSPRFTERHPCLMVILSFAARWKCLHLIMKPRDMQKCLTYIQPYLRSTLNVLITYQDRHFRNLPLNYHSLPEERCDVFQSAVALDSVQLANPIALMNLHWDRIRYLTVTCSLNRVSDVHRALGQMKDLEYLEIGEYALDATADQMQEPNRSFIDLPNLKLLMFRAENAHYSPWPTEDQRALARTRFLKTLLVPNLTTFVDYGNGFPPSTPSSLALQSVSSAYLSLLDRSETRNLTHVNFGMVSVPENELCALLMRNPHIESLAFESNSVSNHFVRLLTYRAAVNTEEECITLPRLRSLTLTGIFNFESAVFVEMVRSRFGAHHAGKAPGMKTLRLHRRGGSLVSSTLSHELEQLQDLDFRGTGFAGQDD